MPLQTGPGCILGTCAAPVFPQLSGNCDCTPAKGGISELYFIPCTATMSEANVTDPDWWQAFITASTLGKSGKGLGSIGQGNVVTDRMSSCEPERVVGITWNLTFQIKCKDKTSARTTTKRLNEMLQRGDKYLLIARMCDGDEEVLPVGKFVASGANWTVPDNSQENQVSEIVLSWDEFAFPETIDVPGLSAILPKAA